MMPAWLEPAWGEFLQRLEQDRLAHALLLSGPAGTGKLDLARQMMACLLCLQPSPGACGECRSCQLLTSGAHPDRFEISPGDGKHQILIDQVRVLGSALALTTTISPRKLALIAPAEAMNTSAANALLKNLEEPPGETTMILVSHDPSSLPVTILSRCQGISVQQPDADRARDWLSVNSGVDAAMAEQALQAAGGSPMAAAGLLEEGQVEAFTELRDRLARLLGHPRAASPLASGLANLDAGRLWQWLSLNSASAARGSLSGESPDWLALDSGTMLNGKRLIQLQQMADRNRRLATTSVRQDLLLQEWLLEWARQPLAITG